MEVLIFHIVSAAVEDAEGAAQVPQRPSPPQLAENVEIVAQPGQGHGVRRAVVASELADKDLSALLQDIILFHEIGHYWLGHMDASVCTFHDSGFAYSLTSALENEANSFVAEYLLDTDETLMVLQESDTFQHAASRLHVPPEILDFKWRMLVSRSLLDRSSPCPAQSDCLKQIDYAGTIGADIP